MDSPASGVASGVRILDFTWYGVGPVTTKYLADNGAEVVKVESRARPDGVRVNAPWKDALPGINRSQFYGSLNSSKKSITLNLGTGEGRELARRLVPRFDVVADSFTAGTMADWGLGYALLCRLKPDVIQMSTCMQGQTGPSARYPGFGNLMAALCGFYYVSGYAEDQIAPPYGAYTDFIVPRYACFALLSALDHHRRTGEGQFIDVSQYEAALHNLAPALTDYFATGTVLGPRRNRSARYCPHGAYRCRDEDGDERWVALAVGSDAEWRALLTVLRPELTDDPFPSQLDRQHRVDEVEGFVAELVRDRVAAEIVPVLQENQVSAYPVQNCLDLRSDENLDGFEFWPWLDQAECGPMPYDGLAYRFERTPGEQTAAPNIGEHNEEILGSLLGLSARELDRLTEDRIVY